MSHTVIYKGWITICPPKRGKDITVVFAPNRFFFRPKNHVIAEKISQDIEKHGPYANVRMWASHHKIGQEADHLVRSYMGTIQAGYSERSGSKLYNYTKQFINMGYRYFLEELGYYHHHYCILEITYSHNEFDMIAHEAELILLRY